MYIMCSTDNLLYVNGHDLFSYDKPTEYLCISTPRIMYAQVSHGCQALLVRQQSSVY